MEGAAPPHPVSAPDPRPASASARPHLGAGRHAGLAAYWLGQFFLWQPLTTVLLQSRIGALVDRPQQNEAIGTAVALGGLLAVVVPIATGAFSDRFQTPWGRRRPVMLAGTLLAMPGLALMATAADFRLLLVGYAVVQLFLNAAGAAYAGLIPDLVPASEVGMASGLLGTAVQVGSMLGVLSVVVFGGGGHPTLPFLIIGVGVSLSLVPTLLAAREPGPRLPSPTVPVRVADLIRPLRSGDFATVVYTRLLVTAAIASVAYFLHSFFRDVTGVADADQFTAAWFAIVLATAIPFGLLAGWWSDRVGRKRFVYLSGASQALVMLLFLVLFTRSQGLTLALGAAYGLGYGCYYAVDWALACDTLPDRERSATYMALFHVAFTLPQVVMPFVLSRVLSLSERTTHSPALGYRGVLLASIVLLALGTWMVHRVRSVR